MSRLKKLMIGVLCLIAVPFFLTRDTAVSPESAETEAYDTVQSDEIKVGFYSEDRR